MCVPFEFALYPRLNVFVDSVVQATDRTITTLGHSTFRRENGRSCNAQGPFRLPVQVMPLSLSMVLCMSLVGSPRMKAIWMICMPFSCQVSDLQ